MQNKRRFIIFLITLFLLLIPLIAMMFTNEVNWIVSDFIVAGFLLLGTGMLVAFVMRIIKKRIYKVSLISVILIVLILIWIELAVGIFGLPFGGN